MFILCPIQIRSNLFWKPAVMILVELTKCRPIYPLIPGTRDCMFCRNAFLLSFSNGKKNPFFWRPVVLRIGPSRQSNCPSLHHCPPYARAITLITRFMGPTWGPSGADRTQLGPMWATWNLLSGYACRAILLWCCANNTVNCTWK